MPCGEMHQCFTDARVIIIMAALWNRAGHCVFALWFLLLSSSSFFLA